MAALEAIQSVLVPDIDPPYTDKNGGTSEGDASAGSDTTENLLPTYKPITTADKAGAGIVTALLLGGMIGGSAWLVFERS